MRIGRWIVAALVALLLSQSGCAMLSATVKADRWQPSPVDEDAIAAGQSRAEVESILGVKGAPIPDVEGAYSYRYEETDASPHRNMIYALIEVPTLWTVGTLIAVPIETSIQRAGQRWATAIYDANGRLVLFRGHRSEPVGIVAATAEGEHEQPASITQYGAQWDWLVESGKRKHREATLARKHAREARAREREARAGWWWQ